MLCSRSASLTSSTRTSSEMASSSLRRFSACSAFLRDEVELLDLGQALDELADVGAEQLVDLGAGRVGVLDRVVQQRDRDRRLVELQVGEDGGDFERMGEIGVAGGALLVAMLLHGIDIGLVEQRLVDVGLVALDPLDKLVLTHHRATVPAAETNMRRSDERRMTIDSHEIRRRGSGRHGRAIRSRRSSPAAPGLRCRAAALPRSCGRRRRCRPRVGVGGVAARRSGRSISWPSASGSSTSTYFCSEWIRSSLRSSGESVSSAISRSATTGFLSLSRSTVIGAPCEICGRGGRPAEPARSGCRPCRCSLRR